METSGVQTWLSLLGAGSVGGFLSDWLLKRGEGRALRGNVRAALGEIAEAVWLDGGAPVEPQWKSLLTSLRTVQAGAFVARVPRPVTELLTRVVVTAWRYQLDRHEVMGDPEGPGMRVEASAIVRDSIQLVVENLHQPIRRRYRASSAAGAIAKRADDLDDPTWKRAWKSASLSSVY